MTIGVQLRIRAGGGEETVQEWPTALPLVLGRQDSQDERLWVVQSHMSHSRLAVVPFGQLDVSRRQLQVERTPQGSLVVKNLSPSIGVRVGGRSIRDNQQHPLALPFDVELANCRITFEPALHTLSHATRFHADLAIGQARRLGDALARLEPEAVNEFVSFLNGVASVLQLSTDERSLLKHASEAVDSLLDVDGAAVFRAPDWQQVGGTREVEPHRGALNRVHSDRRVVWRDSREAAETDSAPVLDCYVAAPIVVKFDGAEEVFGALYAHRQLGKVTSRSPITAIHATLIEFVACAVAAGIVRLKQEKQASRFEQFFPPRLAKRLVEGDQLLKAARKEVTVLFCDIRQFSAVSERVGPQTTSEWVDDVLSALSECVYERDGVLVDYVGDELLAMWGAPEKQDDHAELACQAAMSMIAALTEVNAKWQKRLQAETRVGIGINSGVASVGNTGSRQRFKYGPLGDTVNRASRVQGITKYLRVPVLLTAHTRAFLKRPHPLRRIGFARVVNMEERVELFELLTQPETETLDPRVFEAAIKHAESGRLQEAAELLAPTLNFRAPDHPSLLAFGDIVNRILHNGDGPFEWNFANK